MKKRSAPAAAAAAAGRGLMGPGIEANSSLNQRFLNILMIFGVPTAAAQRRQDRRGPSLRPYLQREQNGARLL